MGPSTSWCGRELPHVRRRLALTVDAKVIGYTGPEARPRTVAVRLPDGRTALSQALGAPLAAQIAVHLAVSPASGRGRTDIGEAYTAVAPDLIVEVLAGTTRHAVVTVTRLH